jgi:hypothetical protein
MPEGTLVVSGSLITPAGMRGLTGAQGPTGPVGSGQGDMVRAVYDTDNNNIVDMAQAVVAGGVTAGMLANGAAVGNIGYTPLNKAGDSIAHPNRLILYTNYGLGAGSYNTAPLLIQSEGAGGRPQIGFHDHGNGGAASLYWEANSHQWRYIDNGGNVHQFWTGYDKIPGSSLASGAAVANLGYTPVNRAGDTLGGTLFAGNPGSIQVLSEVGLGSASWGQSKLYIYCQTGGARPGIGFNNPGLACFLYYDTDNKFRFIDSGGTVHTITSS